MLSDYKKKDQVHSIKCGIDECEELNVMSDDNESNRINSLCGSPNKRSVVNVTISDTSKDFRIGDGFKCDICNFNTDNPNAFNRHLKYSNIHLENVEKNSLRVRNLNLIQNSMDKFKRINSTHHQGKSDSAKRWINAIKKTILQIQTEKANLALINNAPQSKIDEDHFNVHSESIIFWKKSITCHIDIFLHLTHPEFSVVEIIPYDVDKSRELPRIYLNAKLLQLDETVSKLSKDLLDKEIKRRKLLIRKDRFIVLPSIDEIKSSIEKSAMVTCIVNRLKIHYKPSKVLFEISYSDINNNHKDVMLLFPPSDVYPVKLERTNEKLLRVESDAVIQNISKAQEALNESTKKAEKHLDIANIALKIFCPRNNSKVEPQNNTLFKKTVNKLIKRDAVKKTTNVLKI